MDIKIKDKDISLTSSGAFQRVDGLQGVIQQIYIGTKVKKGRFIFDPEMGISVEGIDFNSENVCENFEALLKEMLIDSDDININVNSVESVGINSAIVNITVSDINETESIEVIVNG